MMGRAKSLIVVGMLLVVHPLLAEEQVAPEIVRARVGLAGYYKVGLWTPVEIVLRGGNRPAEPVVELFDADGKSIFKTKLEYG